jgi:hypothetical protein
MDMQKDNKAETTPQKNALTISFAGSGWFLSFL